VNGGIGDLSETAVGGNHDGPRLDEPQFLLDPQRVVTQFAAALRSLHSGAIDESWPVLAPAEQLSTALTRLRSGVPLTLPGPYAGQSPERIADMLIDLHDGLRSPDGDVVPTIGHARLANVVTDRGAVIGWSDTSALATADRYRDLGLAAADVASVIGPGAVLALAEAYGIERPDPRRVEFYALCGLLA